MAKSIPNSNLDNTNMKDMLEKTPKGDYDKMPLSLKKYQTAAGTNATLAKVEILENQGNKTLGT